VKLVSKTREELKKFFEMAGHPEKAQSYVRDSGVVELFDEFANGEITPVAFAKHLQDTKNGILESMSERESSVCE